MNNLTPINNIAIMIAMEGEARPIIEKLQLKPADSAFSVIDSRLNLGLFTGEINGRKVSLIINGKDSVYGVDRVGTQFAARVTQTICEKIKPDVIITAGTAGGLQDAEIGDVYASNSEFVYCDRIINLQNTNYPQYGVGYFPYLPIPDIAEKLNIKLGGVATSNSLDPTSRDLEHLIKLNSKVIDMESAAIAEVARDYNVHIIAIKSVTNFLDKELHTAFEKNYSIATNNLAEKVSALIPLITGKYPSEL